MPENFLTSRQSTGEIVDHHNEHEFELSPPSAMESITRAEVDMQITTAKRYPRSYSVVKKKMIDLATLDTETAESCFYKLARSGKSIEGPSVRLAEIAAHAFGNMRSAAMIVGNDGKTITSRGVCHDLETNSSFAVEVKRRITDKNGKTFSEDMQVVTGNAACSIALRNAIFKAVPFALIKPVYDQARQAAVGDIKTLTERRTRMLKAFAALGINEARVLASLDKEGVEDIGLTELASLIGLHTAIKDGEQNIDEAFPPVPLKQVAHKPQALTPPVATSEQASTQLAKPQAAAPQPQPPQQVPATEAAQAASIPDADLPSTLERLYQEAGFSEGDVVAWGVSVSLFREGAELPGVPLSKMRMIVEGWDEEVKAQIAAMIESRNKA